MIWKFRMPGGGDRREAAAPSAKIGRGEWIRTTDPSVPNRVLYQAEPRPDEGENVLELATGGRDPPNPRIVLHPAVLA